MWNTPDIVPSLKYNDFPKAIEWLGRVFGFRERTDARLTYAGDRQTWFEVGNGLFNISTPDSHWEQDSNSSSKGFSMKVYIENLDEHYAHAKAEGAKIISEPENGFWGGRIYRVLDCEGNQWEFSQRGLDLAVEDWKLPPGVTRGV
jgi:uncharacterized glyoxalase superfamily protein PhnB